MGKARQTAIALIRKLFKSPDSCPFCGIRRRQYVKHQIEIGGANEDPPYGSIVCPAHRAW